MKVNKQREPGSSRSKRPNVRGQHGSGASGSALDLVNAGGHAAERTNVTDGVERAVLTLEQRRDSPAAPVSAIVQTAAADDLESDLASSVTPVAPIAEPAGTEPVTSTEIAAAIAEGAATPFDQLVASQGVPQEPLALDAEQSGKAEPAPEVPELEVERVKRRG
ncbi:MAG TPA: hypothetical protein VFU02_01055 [Polyangiaceae bacterium]|nr:hypothetical protein [Polyangiaceae bacterium]